MDSEIKDEKIETPEFGICQECNNRPATADYNGHGFYVCDPCYERLTKYFEEEYD